MAFSCPRDPTMESSQHQKRQERVKGHHCSSNSAVNQLHPYYARDLGFKMSHTLLVCSTNKTRLRSVFQEPQLLDIWTLFHCIGEQLPPISLLLPLLCIKVSK